MYQVPHKKSIKSVRFLANHDKNLLQEQGNQGTTPLILAIIYEFTEIIIYLVEEAQVDRYQQTQCKRHDTLYDS